MKNHKYLIIVNVSVFPDNIHEFVLQKAIELKMSEQDCNDLKNFSQNNADDWSKMYPNSTSERINHLIKNIRNDVKEYTNQFDGRTKLHPLFALYKI